MRGRHGRLNITGSSLNIEIEMERHFRLSASRLKLSSRWVFFFFFALWVILIHPQRRQLSLVRHQKDMKIAPNNCFFQ